METIIASSPVTLTAGAVKEIKRLISEPGFDATQYLRIGVKGGGCSGISYVLGFDQKTDADKEFEIETFQKVLDVNLTGTFRTCMAFQPQLAQSKGSIVNIASMNATLALPRIPAYCASKGGVVMLTYPEADYVTGTLVHVDGGFGA